MRWNKDNIHMKTVHTNNKIISEAIDVQAHNSIGHITISVNKDNSWMISEWFVNHDYQHQGLGTELFRESINYLSSNFPYPDKIEYVWNGANRYVYDWLQKNFAPISQCSMAVQKYNSDDDWLSHIYELDVRSVYEYFGIFNQEKDVKELE